MSTSSLLISCREICLLRFWGDDFSLPYLQIMRQGKDAESKPIKSLERMRKHRAVDLQSANLEDLWTSPVLLKATDPERISLLLFFLIAYRINIYFSWFISASHFIRVIFLDKLLSTLYTPIDFPVWEIYRFFNVSCMTESIFLLGISPITEPFFHVLILHSLCHPIML